MIDTVLNAYKPQPVPLRRANAAKPARSKRRWADAVFASSTALAAGVILVLLMAVAVFLVMSSQNAIFAGSDRIAAEVSFARGMSFWQFAGAAIFGTLLASAIALAIAVPFSIAIALFISHYAPRQIAAVCGYTIDLLAAIPSVVFGLWGMWTLEPLIRPLFELLPASFGFVPPARNIVMGGLVLAIMIVPIITALCREVFIKTPPLQQEAALALGATRWEMITMVVLPIGRSGIVSASMLGLGRALGETMALLMVLSPGLLVNMRIFSPGQHSTIASQIALRFPEASGLETDFLIALGLVLFALTFAVNFGARALVARHSDFSGANA
ncbi:MAG: phosphate ABC transporter permease subunit PstC [Actinomycetaceae bacterium]|nr:phosphate ABC transporter permease subunit PstC [Arcanobacterium sp.]MDD7504430.1 phosphate ABC transporter permease subunit PstC [Actinomycetaceae bacterium]MDY6143688.1 phosphate ABC transporter permease subunit PstC [Arcanobacterium sp.]